MHQESHDISLASYTILFFLAFIMTGGEDYTEINDVGGQPLVIDSKPVNGSHCFSINITDDNIVEDGEEFNVTLHLAIDDPALLRSVTLDPSVATIRIIDNDGKYLVFIIIAI